MAFEIIHVEDETLQLLTKISADLGLHVSAFIASRELADFEEQARGGSDRRYPPLRRLLEAFAALPCRESRMQAIAMVESLAESTRRISSR